MSERRIRRRGGVSAGSLGERGQVVVLFALLLPVILGFGSVVMSIGNWYVHKKHLQTLADAGAFASGLAFTGCYQDATLTNPLIAQAALEFAGDPNRDPLTENRQLEEPADAHAVLNSDTYWAGNPYPPDNTLGLPCDTKFLDVKLTEDKVPLLFRWLPASPSPKAKARVEIRKTLGITGMLPLAVPEVDPERVAALVVNEDVAASSPASVVGSALLNHNTPAGPPDLSAYDVWHGDLNGVNLNGNENFGVIIVSSRDPALSLSGSLQTICTQNPVQVTCYRKPWSSTGGLSFIHSYSDSSPGGNPPAIRQVELVGGCWPGPPTDLSAPYFNETGGCAITIQAKIDVGVSGDPTAPNAPCAVMTASPGGPMSWSAGGIGGAMGTWTASFTPSSGRNVVNISWDVDQGGPCTGPDDTGSFPRVAAPYVADTFSGPVQYLAVTNNNPPFGFANSINGTSSASLHVTVGLFPPLIDANVLDPPVRLRFGSPSGSQNQALDCDKNINFKDELLNGCLNPYRENVRNGVCTGYGPGNLPVPPIGPFPGDDCIIVETGDKSGQIRQAMDERWGRNGGPTCQTLNNWPTAVGDPLPDPLTDERFVVLFISDENTFGASGSDIYPVRRFAGFYLTAADGLNCPGDDPAVPGARNVWGHFMTYVVPNPGGTPSDELCAFTEAGTCIPILVE